MSFNTDVTSQGANRPSKTGSLNLQGQLSNESNQLELKVTQFPNRILDLIARIKGSTRFPCTTLFGDTLNATLSMGLKNSSGPVVLNLNTANSRLSLKGHLKEGVLSLDSTFHAQSLITPEMSRLFLKEINPLGISYFNSQDPVTIEISSQGFSLPVSPFDLKKAQIPSATIELGKINCRNEGNLNLTLALLRNSSDKDLTVWFAPIDFTLINGVVDLERTEIYIDKTYDVAVWGDINLVKDKVDMTLGLTASTLKKAFGIKNLPNNYVLTLPMKGTTDHVKINSKKATAKIALLLAWQQKMLAAT